MRLLRGAPYFPVADVEKTSAYYDRVLGFATAYRAGEPPMFAICRRDGLDLMLRGVDAPDRIRPMEGGTWDAFFWVDDAAALHAEFAARGASVVYGPVREEYGVLEFAIRDLDGHGLGFGQTLAP